MSEPRDTPAPYEPSRGTGTTLWPPIEHEYQHADPQPPTYLWWVWLIVFAGIVIGSIGLARAAETPARWEMTLLHAGKDYDLVSATHRVLATYDSREECRVMITRVKVHVSGARLVCTLAPGGWVR